MSPSPAAQPRVLIVDDDADIRDLLVELLDQEGYTASAAADGQAALAYLDTHPAPCCIILDLYMPILDGWQFHRVQLRTPHLANIPVIVMSAVAHALEPLAWFQAAGYLHKPFGVDAMLALVVPLCAAPASVRVGGVMRCGCCDDRTRCRWSAAFPYGPDGSSAHAVGWHRRGH